MSTGDRLVFTLCVAVLGGAGMLALLRASGINALPEQSLCASQLLLGLPCPGCGLTRSFVAFASADLPRALRLNPAGPVLFVLLALTAATRAVKMLRPAGTAWRSIDAALAAAIVLTLVVRTILFYL